MDDLEYHNFEYLSHYSAKLCCRTIAEYIKKLRAINFI